MCVWAPVCVCVCALLPRVLITTNIKCMTLYPVFMGDSCVWVCVSQWLGTRFPAKKKHMFLIMSRHSRRTQYFTAAIPPPGFVQLQRAGYVCVYCVWFMTLVEQNKSFQQCYIHTWIEKKLITLVSFSRELNGNNLTRINRNDFSGLKYLRVLWVLHLYFIFCIYYICDDHLTSGCFWSHDPVIVHFTIRSHYLTLVNALTTSNTFIKLFNHLFNII